MTSIEDEWAIRGQLERYCRYNDDGAYAELCQLFTEGARLHAMGSVHSGRDAIRAVFGESVGSRRKRPHTQHQLTNVVIHVEGSLARAESDWAMLLRGSTGELKIRLAGRFRDRLERGSDGTWRIAEREIVPLARAPE